MRRFWVGPACFLTAFAYLCVGDASSTSPTTARASRDLSKDKVIGMLERLQTQGHVFSSQGMVEIVNELRHLGKDKALEALGEYYAVQSDVAGAHEMRELNVVCVCRVLFVPPNGIWQELWFDSPGMNNLDGPGYNPAGRRGFPMYPMALSEGFPFLLITGWERPNGRSGPIPDEGKRHLQICSTLSMISKDLPTSGFDTAAQKLVDSNAFKGLFVGRPPGDTYRAMILKQATNTLREHSSGTVTTEAAKNPAVGTRY
jgi:hypothetical protein